MSCLLNKLVRRRKVIKIGLQSRETKLKPQIVLSYQGEPLYRNCRFVEIIRYAVRRIGYPRYANGMDGCPYNAPAPEDTVPPSQSFFGVVMRGPALLPKPPSPPANIIDLELNLRVGFNPSTYQRLDQLRTW